MDEEEREEEAEIDFPPTKGTGAKGTKSNLDEGDVDDIDHPLADAFPDDTDLPMAEEDEESLDKLIDEELDGEDSYDDESGGF